VNQPFREATGKLLVELGPVFDVFRFEVIADHFVGPAKIGHTEPEAVCFGNVEAALGIESKVAGVFDKGKGDPCSASLVYMLRKENEELHSAAGVKVKEDNLSSMLKPIEISATDLVKEFKTDKAAAEKKYRDRHFKVVGFISEFKRGSVPLPLKCFFVPKEVMPEFAAS